MAGPLTHAMLGFEVKGGWRDVKGSVAITALQYLMGGGGSFSAGGPGECLLVAEAYQRALIHLHMLLQSGRPAT